MTLIRRYARIRDLLAARQSVLLLGPRGSGKTFYLTRLIEDFERTVHIDLLRETEFERFVRNPGAIEREVMAQVSLGGEPVLFFIDEIQRVPALLNEIHRLIELCKGKVIFLLAGSSARKLKTAHANLLAGRAISIHFFPLGIDEISYSIDDDEELLRFGLLPQVYTHTDPTLKMAFLRSYVGTYLSEEIQREAQIRNLSSFARFLELAAVESGGVVNYTKIAKIAGVSDHTIKEYFQILVDTLVGYLVPAWCYGIREQIRQAPKQYLFDTGVINALSGEIGSEVRPATRRFGRLYENFVVTQVIHRLRREDSPFSVYHYRDTGDREVDLILQKNPFSRPVAIEVTSSPQLTSKDIGSLLYFQRTYPESECLVVCRTPRPFVIETEGGRTIRCVSLPMLFEMFPELEAESAEL